MLFAFSLGETDLRRELSAVGLVAIAGTIIEMGVAFFGDGGPDPKHFLLANVFFDVVVLTALGVVVRFGSAAGNRRRAERIAGEAASD